MKKIIFSICLSMSAGLISAQSLTEKDRQFASEAAQSGLLEVKLAELSVERATTAEIKALGQMMVVDHTKANNELKALALSKNIVLPGSLSAEGQKEYNELAAKTGLSFDKAYAAQMVKDHEKAVAAFKAENLGDTDKEMRNWAAVTLPVLEHHLMMSREADLKLNK